MIRGLTGSATFASLQHRNFRLYFAGMFTSQAGTWMTRIAQTLLVLRLTDGSGVAIGFLAACQFGPVLLLGSWSGTVADRSDKWKLLVVVQAAMLVLSASLGILVLLGFGTLAVIFVVALLQGVCNAFDAPTRRTFVIEMVPEHRAANAISLNSAALVASRIFGPALAGVVVVTLGHGWCFIVDAATYACVLDGYRRMDRGALNRHARAVRAKGQIVDGWRYAFKHPELGTFIVTMGIIGLLAFNPGITTPLLVTELGGSDLVFTMVFSVLSFGSVIGALATARRPAIRVVDSLPMALAFGVSMAAFAFAPNMWWLFPLALPVGFTSVAFVTMANGASQLAAAPEYRGRVSAIQTMLFMGSTPIGGPVLGAISDATNARWSVAVGALACFVAAAVGYRMLPRRAGTAASPTPNDGEIAGSWRRGRRPPATVGVGGDPRQTG